MVDTITLKKLEGLWLYAFKGAYIRVLEISGNQVTLGFYNTLSNDQAAVC